MHSYIKKWVKKGKWVTNFFLEKIEIIKWIKMNVIPFDGCVSTADFCPRRDMLFRLDGDCFNATFLDCFWYFFLFINRWLDGEKRQKDFKINCLEYLFLISFNKKTTKKNKILCGKKNKQEKKNWTNKILVKHQSNFGWN